MFGTMGFSELIIILIIVLIIFGAGKLPQIGEGLGKALKGFKKEVHEVPPLDDPNAAAEPAAVTSAQPPAQVPPAGTLQEQAQPSAPQPAAPYQPGPELTPGTTAAAMYGAAAPQAYRPPHSQPDSSAQTSDAATPSVPPPPTMEERAAQPAPVARAQYPPLPAAAQVKPGAKRPSAVVNKDAVARVQAKQASMKQAGAQQQGIPSAKDMQSVGEGLGDALRTFRQAAADVKGAIEPEVRTLQSEIDSAQKEIEQSVEAAKQMPAVQEDPKQSA